MRERILPAIVTTRCALKACIKEQIPLIYIYGAMCKNRIGILDGLMKRNGYVFEMRTKRDGCFYSKGIDIGDYEIDDPFCFY